MSQTSETYTLYRCRLYPDKLFTAQRDLHRVEHRSSSSKYKLNKLISKNGTTNPKSKVKKSTTNLELPIPGQSSGKISISITILVTTDDPDEKYDSDSDEGFAILSKSKKSINPTIKTTQTPATNPGPSCGSFRTNVSRSQALSLPGCIGYGPTPRMQLATRTGNFPIPTTGPTTQPSTSKKAAPKPKTVKTSNLTSRKFNRGRFHRPVYTQLATYAISSNYKPSLQTLSESAPSTMSLGRLAKSPTRVTLASQNETRIIINGQAMPRLQKCEELFYSRSKICKQI